MPINQAELGRRIRAAREACGLTQEALAQQVGLTRIAVVQIEQGNRAVSSLELDRIAFVLGRDIGDFFAEQFSEQDALIALFRLDPQIADRNPLEPLDVIASQAATGAESPARLIEIVTTRHRDVQASKHKGMWIEPGDRWTLMPGFGLASDGPPQAEVKYLHTFRVPNAYSFLADLGLSGVEVPDGEA